MLPVHIPPLRERPADLRLLIDHFVAAAAAELGRRLRQALAGRGHIGGGGRFVGGGKLFAQRRDIDDPKTIADLAAVEEVGRIHVAEALSYRRQAPRA